MHRTNIVLEEWHYQLLKERAEREGKSMSAVVRELIEASLHPAPGRRAGTDQTGGARAQGNP